jgi:Bifunctional DNA primase/polymerase, N-terminal
MACLSEAALELAGAGHPVLPLHTPLAGRCSCGRNCGRPGKHPRSTYGLKSATTDERRIEAWWHGQPEANIGLRCDGLVVFDLDYGGRRSLQELEWQLGELPETRGQSSGRGEHRLYSTPPEVLLGNSTAPLGHPRGLDLRAGARGYVVAAPSLHASGRAYRWLEPDAPIAPLPQAWLERLLELPSLPEPTALVAAEGTTCYGLAALEAELRKVRSAPQGRRNNQLNTSVFKLAQLVAGGQLDLFQLEAEATAAGLDVGLGAAETEDTIASAVTAGFRQPRGPR